VLAFGISDQLPAVPGLTERWGRSVIHHPYCHGYEFSGRRLGVLDVSPMSVHQAMLIADIARDAHSVTWACADGVTAGTAAHRSLVF
jgi:thioredoxin reductase